MSIDTWIAVIMFAAGAPSGAAYVGADSRGFVGVEAVAWGGAGPVSWWALGEVRSDPGHRFFLEPRAILALGRGWLAEVEVNVVDQAPDAIRFGLVRRLSIGSDGALDLRMLVRPDGGAGQASAELIVKRDRYAVLAWLDVDLLRGGKPVAAGEVRVTRRVGRLEVGAEVRRNGYWRDPTGIAVVIGRSW